jgi:hypothetical protein
MPTTITGDTGVSQIQSGATSGGLPVFQCRAWVNFDGTRDSTGAASTANTARFIRASGNVTSVVRNAAGDYTINFTTAMPDGNYALMGSAGDGVNANRALILGANLNYSTTSCRIRTGTATAYSDTEFTNVAIFR